MSRLHCPKCGYVCSQSSDIARSIGTVGVAVGVVGALSFLVGGPIGAAVGGGIAGKLATRAATTAGKEAGKAICGNCPKCGARLSADGDLYK